MRTPVLTTFRTGDPVIDKNLDHVAQTLNPVLRNPLLAAADFRWTEVAPTSATAAPTFALQYRTAPAAWATIATFTSAGQIVQPAWIAPTFTNSWANFGGGNLSAGYMKDVLGVVHLRGTISSGTIGLGAFTLPTAYRPSANTNYATVSNGAFGYLNINSGTGVVLPVSGSNTYFALDGITFDTRS